MPFNERKPYFLSEVSSNHHQDIERCFDFIDKSAEVGCDGVKFQLFKIDQLFAPEILQHSETHRLRKQWELSVEFLPRLAERAQQKGIDFSCTPFYLAAVDELEAYVPYYKIASYELMWDDLLIKCARTGKPVVLSTGMASEAEIAHAVATLHQADCDDVTLLHCVSAYPTPVEEANLAVIGNLKETFGCKVGWSDHTVSPAIINRAVNYWQADFVEFHLDLDGRGPEYAAGHCWLPDQIGQVIADIRMGFTADGQGVIGCSPSELPDREWRADPSDGLRPLQTMRDKWKAQHMDDAAE